MRLAVVVPTLHRPQMLKEALASVAAQTHRDFEVVVVADAPCEGSRGACNDLGYTYLPNPGPRGANGARNAGVAATSAPWIAFLDDDDRWDESRLERLSNTLDWLSDDVNLVATGWRSFHPQRNWRTDDMRLRSPHPRKTNWLSDVLRLRSMSNAVVRRSALKAIGGLRNDLPSHQDVDLLMRLPGGRLYLGEPLVSLRLGYYPRISLDAEAVSRGRELIRG